MKEKKEKKERKPVPGYVKYLICIAVLVAGFFAVAAVRDLWHQTELYYIFFYLTDAFTVPGILLLCFAGLCFASSKGAMDGLMYGIKHMFAMLFPPLHMRRDETYYDYVESRKDKRFKSFGCMLITGGAFFLIGIVFLLLFLKVSM